MNHDQLIDSVARQMTESDPSSDFRARVIAALPAAGRHHWLRFAIPAAAVGALAVAMLFRQTATLPKPAESMTAAVRVPVAPVVPVVPVVPDVTRRNPSLPADVPLPSHVAPLDEVTPLSIPPIQPIGVSIAPITVTPIVTEPLALPALDSRSGGRE